MYLLGWQHKTDLYFHFSLIFLTTTAFQGKTENDIKDGYQGILNTGHVGLTDNTEQVKPFVDQDGS